MRVATQLSGAMGRSAVSLTMNAIIPVLRDEQEMLRALLLTLAEPAEQGWAADESRSVRALVAAAEQDKVPWGVRAPRDIGQPGPIAAALLDSMIEGCWGRRALWRALAEGWRRVAPQQALDFSSLAGRTESMIVELEQLQGGLALPR